MRSKIPPDTQKITSAAENVFEMSLMTKLSLALNLNDPHNDVYML